MIAVDGIHTYSSVRSIKKKYWDCAPGGELHWVNLSKHKRGMYQGHFAPTAARIASIQMSRFIPAGQSDLTELKAKEASASSQYQREDEDREAPSLYEQMRLNHMEKECEYQEKVKLLNQPHKIDVREQKFYQELKEKEASKEEDRKRELEEGLQAFEQTKKKRSLKETQALGNPSKKEIVLPKVNVIKKKVSRKAPNTTTSLPKKANSPPKSEPKKTGLVGDYTSSDSDSY